MLAGVKVDSTSEGYKDYKDKTFGQVVLAGS